MNIFCDSILTVKIRICLRENVCDRETQKEFAI